MQVTRVCPTCVCTACSARGTMCAPRVFTDGRAVFVCVYTHGQALCVHVCVFLWVGRPPWPHTRPVPWGLAGPRWGTRAIPPELARAARR